MRLLQNFGLTRAYARRFEHLAAGSSTFGERREAFLADRFGASHFLSPVLAGSETAFFTNGDDVALQRMWAVEQGMPPTVSLPEILLAQVESHRTEVFYNIDPVRYAGDFVRRLPGTVRCRIAWRAAPSPGIDFGGYDAVVCNFDGILDGYRRLGLRAEWFAPAHDPVMDGYADSNERPVDVVFVGGYSRHHANRAAILEAVAQRSSRFSVEFYLDRSRLTRLSESPLGWCLPLAGHRRPGAIRSVSRDPVFGRDLYLALSRAKVVLNGAVDMAGADRGNMRCFEALGCGALMVSDAGHYPPGMEDGLTMLTYGDAGEAVAAIERALAEPDLRSRIAAAGHTLVAREYSKERQWQAFERLVGSL